MSKHTEGPWCTRRAEVGSGPEGSIDYAILCEGKTILAEAYEIVGYGTEGKYHRLNAEANARLIAAAPELLDALKRAREYVLDCGADRSMAPLVEQMSNAIAKAEGT
jgi:hypothetical protein